MNKATTASNRSDRKIYRDGLGPSEPTSTMWDTIQVKDCRQKEGTRITIMPFLEMKENPFCMEYPRTQVKSVRIQQEDIKEQKKVIWLCSRSTNLRMQMLMKEIVFSKSELGALLKNFIATACSGVQHTLTDDWWRRRQFKSHTPATGKHQLSRGTSRQQKKAVWISHSIEAETDMDNIQSYQPVSCLNQLPCLTTIFNLQIIWSQKQLSILLNLHWDVCNRPFMDSQMVARKIFYPLREQTTTLVVLAGPSETASKPAPSLKYADNTGRRMKYKRTIDNLGLKIDNE